MEKSMTRRRAVIVGGSIGGLFAGLHLLRRGWEVTIHERVPVPLSGRGAGIVTHAELFEALATAGLAAGDGSLAGQGYERLVSRWRKVGAYESAM